MFGHPIPVMGISKRIFDIAASLAGLIALSPLMAILWVLVRLGSPGPGLFAQQRVGRNEQIFTCYKFRTMHVGTAQRATHEVSKSAITSTGKILRRFKLDELPQLWNVLIGDMSLVGPRPCLPVQDALIAERRKRGVYTLRPGVTGLAQVRNIDMSKPERLAEIDAEYMQHQSLMFDLRLILKTIFPG